MENKKPPSLNHIGVAVNHLPELKRLFSFLNLEIQSSEEVKEQKVTTHFIPLSSPASSLEFLTSTDESSFIAQFLKKRGPGIHHLSFLFQKGELDGLCQKLTQAGYRLIYDHLQNGAHHMKINFIHPSSAGGILIELMEPEQ